MKAKKIVDYLNMTERRAIAFWIDLFSIGFFIAIPYLIMELSKLDYKIFIFKLSDLWVLFSALIGYIYLLIRDIIRGQSIGKRLVHIKIVKSSGDKASIPSLILHDLFIFIYPVEILFLLFTGKTLSEKVADVTLIIVK